MLFRSTMTTRGGPGRLRGVDFKLLGARVDGSAGALVIRNERDTARHGAVVQDRQHRGAHLSSETVLVIKALNEHETESLTTGEVDRHFLPVRAPDLRKHPGQRIPVEDRAILILDYDLDAVTGCEALHCSEDH